MVSLVFHKSKYASNSTTVDAQMGVSERMSPSFINITRSPPTFSPLEIVLSDRYDTFYVSEYDKAGQYFLVSV